MYKAMIAYYDDDSNVIGMDVSDGYCFETNTDAHEWAEDYASDKMLEVEADHACVNVVKKED
jgi:hypothetical protein